MFIRVATVIALVVVGSNSFAGTEAPLVAGSMAVPIGSIAPLTTTGAMTTSLSAQCAANKLACVMAAMGIAQMASTLMSAKSGTGAAKSAMSPASYASTDFGGGYTGAVVDDKIAYAEQQMNTAKANLAKSAKDIDLAKGTVKTPKGTVPLSSLSSGKAMADAGLIDPSQIAAVDDMLKKQNSFNIPSMNNGTGGGGGGGSGRSNLAALPTFQMPNYGEKEKPAAPVAAGLVKLANGEPIGTASDNIFNMLHNRYQIKVKEKIFVGQEGGTPTTN